MLSETLKLVEERLDAADVLCRPPHRAESMHVLARALAALEDARTDLKIDSQGDSQMEPRLTTTSAGGNLSSRLRAARQKLDGMPLMDARLSPGDLAFGREARDLARKALSDFRRSARSRQANLARKVGMAVGGALAVGMAIFVSTHLQDRFTVTASGVFSHAFPAENAIDGNPGVEWLAPEGADGWVQLEFVRPIAVGAVRVVNSHNPPHNDRATKDLDVELYNRSKLVNRVRFTFATIETTYPAPANIAIEGKQVTRVRFVAASYHGKGAGLGEVEVIER